MAARAERDGRVRVGIAGLGRFGKLHAGVLNRLPHVEIAAVCDPVEAERETARATYGNPATYADLDGLLGHDGLDCLFLVTPEQFHAEQARKAIARGLPTFLEKPLATTAAEGAELVNLAAAAGIHLQVGFVLRFETQHAYLKQEIASGRFGELVTLRLKRNCSRAWFDIYGDRAHSVHETIVHDIDLAVWYTGSRCKSVYALQRFVTGHKFPDACLALLQFESGAICALETSWFVPDRAPANVLTDTWNGAIDAELEIVGTKQSARLRLFETTLQIWTDDITKHPEAGLWPEVYGQVGGALREEDTHFIECVAGHTRSDVASVEDAVEGLRIAEAIIESATTGKDVRLR